MMTAGTRKTHFIWEAARRAPSKSATGQALTVVQLSLGLKDKPGEAPDEGCRDGSGGHDGGSEYWLLAASAQPRLLLAFCNDGYGAAGVGGDEVEVAENP